MTSEASPPPRDDPHALERFVQAQEPVYPQVLGELRAQRKCSHWMWFVFPQLRGLGHSAMAERYAIHDATEARAYAEHRVLGPRLVECCALVLASAQSAHDIFGSPDDLKLRSCATLFDAVARDATVFERLLAAKFAGQADPRTLALLRADDSEPR